MKIFNFANGLTENQKKVALSANPRLSFVVTTEGEIFEFKNVYNNSEKDCYKLAVIAKTGVTVNINMNNGIAYLTNLSI